MNECAVIAWAASKHGIPASVLCALRIIENGRPGRDFGVLSVQAETYEEQADIAARSFKNGERRYLDAKGMPPRAGDRYTDDFLRFFSARWAPVGAANDPDGLNNNHASNLIAAYSWFK